MKQEATRAARKVPSDFADIKLAFLLDVTGIDDKREMTVLLACTLSGKLLHSQLIYAGKTPWCHPVLFSQSCDFPHNWDVWHSPSHWSIMLLYLKSLLRMLSLQGSHWNL